MTRLALYGFAWPRWLTYRRGRRWLRHGFCPSCYSSPPRPDCPVCRGAGNYGRDLPVERREAWRSRWDAIAGPRGER